MLAYMRSDTKNLKNNHKPYTYSMGMDSPSSPSPDLSLTLTLNPNPCTQQQLQQPDQFQLEAMKPEERGIKLIHLLLSCAHHVSTSDLQSADHCLRLISSLSSPSGDSIQRLASRLAASLASRLLRRLLGCPGLLSALRHPQTLDSTRVVAATAAYSRALPYLPFANALIISTLLRALRHHRSVHIVVLGTPYLDLWGALLRAFTFLSSCPVQVKITCAADSLDSFGLALVKEAESLGAPFRFRFRPVTAPLSELTAAMLMMEEGEALAVVSVLRLHTLLAAEDGERKMGKFLSMIKALRPKVVVAVEQESDHNSPHMADRFVELLHHYGALFDSVDSAAASGLMTGEERTEVEEMLGREMENVVACEGEERVERHEKSESWVERMEMAGLVQVRRWDEVVAEASQVVGSFRGKGYGVVVHKGCPMVCWHGRPMYAVSAWHC